jgi:site-specific DNA-methyltransferase (adenine-specific)
MTRCYEYYCLFKNKPEKCDLSVRGEKYVKAYMKLLTEKGIRFDGTPADKELFLGCPSERVLTRVHNCALFKCSVPLPENPIQQPKVIQGDFREKGAELGNESVSLILTDPPYGADYLDLWGPLGELARRVLVPSGFLVAYVGQVALPQKMAELGKSLDYVWTGAYLLTISNMQSSAGIINYWKPILVYEKPPKIQIQPYWNDIIKGQGPEKGLHDWQQNEADLDALIESFCPEGGVILDPMAGTGTTLRAAMKHGRKCVGIELNEKTAEICRKVLNIEK